MKKNLTPLKPSRGLMKIFAASLFAVSFLSVMVFASIEMNGVPVRNTNTYTPPPEKDKKGTLYSVSSSVYGNGLCKRVVKCDGVYYSIKYNCGVTNSVKIDENAKDGCKEGNMAKYGFSVENNPE